MTQYERMRIGMIYDPADKEIMELQRPFQQRLWELNRTGISDTERKERYMREVFAACGKNCWIELPFWETGAERICTSAQGYISISTSPWWMTDRSLLGIIP